MSNHEQLARMAVANFDKAIYSLRDSQIERVEDVAKRTVDRIRSQQILTALDNGNFHSPAATNYHLYELPDSGPAMFIPIITMNPDHILSDSTEKIAADLVRTTTVADQYPFAGYQRRMKDVYTYALAQQKSWLEIKNSPPILYDPREQNHEDIIKLIIGDTNFYTDVGFEDWLKAIDEYSKQAETHQEKKRIESFNNKMGHFMSVRAKFVPMLHEQATQVNKNKYLIEMTPDKRALATAMALLGISLYAGGAQN